MSIDWPSLATRATANANFDLGRDEANTGLRVDQDGHAPAVGSAFMSEGGGSSYAGGSSSLDRFLEMMTADDTKKVLRRAWLYQIHKFDMVIVAGTKITLAWLL